MRVLRRMASKGFEALRILEIRSEGKVSGIVGPKRVKHSASKETGSIALPGRNTFLRISKR